MVIFAGWADVEQSRASSSPTSTRSKILRSLVVGAALAGADRLDWLDAIEPSFDALVDVPSVDVDGVLAGL